VAEASRPARLLKGLAAVLLALSGGVVHGQQSVRQLETNGLVARGYANQQQVELAAARTHRPWIWEARRGDARLWIAGCLHLGAEPDQMAFPTYLPYYERAGVIYFEVMPASWENPDINALLSRRGFVPDRRTIEGRISSRGWAEVQRTLQNEPDLLSRVRTMEPWFAALTLSREGYRRAGLNRQNALEEYLEQRARIENKPVGALEKAQDQIFAMADTNFPDQERNLQYALENYRRSDFGTAEIRRAWRLGDEAQLRTALGCDSAETAGDEMHQNLLAKRNQAWVRKIESIAATGRSALLVVGVEHLVAEPQSLPSLLRAAGMVVNRVNPGGGAGR